MLTGSGQIIQESILRNLNTYHLSMSHNKERIGLGYIENPNQVGESVCLAVKILNWCLD